jgi:capsular polysaccharide biosynthesis protein
MILFDDGSLFIRIQKFILMSFELLEWFKDMIWIVTLDVILQNTHTQCVQVLLGLCSLKIQDVNYFQNFTLFIQNSLLLNQFIAGIV